MSLGACERKQHPLECAIFKRRKQLAVQRHLRIAEQYIANVALGEFPKRKAR